MNSKVITLVGVCAIASASQAQILDQITGDLLNGNGFASQDFEAVNNAFDIAAIDNFTTTSSQNIITRFDAGIVNYGGTVGVRSINNVQSFRVEVYSSSAAGAASLTGDVASVIVPFSSATITNVSADRNIVSVPVNIALSANTSYWIAMIPVMNFGGGFGQTGILASITGTPLGADARQVNPGGGFAFPGNNTQILNGGAGQNLAYRIQAVPEPASLAVLGLGLLAVARRKKSA